MHETLFSDQIHVAVDLLILTVRNGSLTLLLSKRTEPPYQHCWALPGRLVAQSESAESCAQDLLSEMLPDVDAYLEQLYTFTNVNRDPRGRVISIAYLVILPWERLSQALRSPERKMHCFTAAPALQTLRLTGEDGATLSDDQLAFDHGRMIQTGLNRLKGKIDYTELGFRFLDQPDGFSLSQLQSVYEAVLGQTLDTSNFRRLMLNRYEATGRIEQTQSAIKQGRGRPAALYRYLPQTK